MRRKIFILLIVSLLSCSLLCIDKGIKMVLPDGGEAAESKAIKEEDIIGGWKVIASDMDCEEVLFDISEGIHYFRTFLYERPFDIGEWKLENDKLIISTSRFLNTYTGISVEKNILKFYDMSEQEQKFEKITH